VLFGAYVCAFAVAFSYPPVIINSKVMLLIGVCSAALARITCHDMMAIRRGCYRHSKAVVARRAMVVLLEAIRGLGILYGCRRHRMLMPTIISLPLRVGVVRQS
jgi:hypothetical protein